MINLELSKSLFNETYLPYLQAYTHKYEVYYGGSGSGKSYFIAQKLIVKACKSKRRILVIRKVSATLKDSCFKLLLDMLSNWKLLEYCKVNKTDYTIELPNGSEFILKGLDDPEKIKSIVGITDCWCEEATELSEEDFEQLTLRVRENIKYLQFFVSFNPISKANWVYSKWFAPKVKIGDDTFILKTTYKDNPKLPEDYIKTLESKIHTNPTYYRIYALGEFCSLDKLVYNNYEVKEFDRPNGKLLVGLDFGFVNDPTALICSILDEENKTIYIFDEWGDTNKTNDEIANIVVNLGYSKSVIVADSAEPKSIQELRRKGLYRIKESVKGKDSILHGIQRLQQYKLVVSPKCTQTITELENYSWEKDKKTGEYINKPVDQFNHFLDALRYSLQCYDKGTLKVIDKSLIGL